MHPQLYRGERPGGRVSNYVWTEIATPSQREWKVWRNFMTTAVGFQQVALTEMMASHIQVFAHPFAPERRSTIGKLLRNQIRQWRCIAPWWSVLLLSLMLFDAFVVRCPFPQMAGKAWRWLHKDRGEYWELVTDWSNAYRVHTHGH